MGNEERRLIDANKFGMYLADVQLANRGWKDDICKFLDDVMLALDEQPTVDAVEVVHGRWEESHEIKSFRHTNIPVVQCSECKIYFCDIINNHHYMYHYCPNCGADMR